jgi:hypothetical protein
MSAANAQPVWSRLEDAKEKLGYADAQLLDLQGITSILTDPAATERQSDEVIRIYLFWLVATRQVAVSINEAWRAAGSPAEFASWWTGLSSDPTHAFFRRERNAGLKGGAKIVALESVVDPRIAPVAYWSFASGPHRGEPILPRCQMYADWLYYKMWAPACELLFEWTSAERLSSSV